MSGGEGDDATAAAALGCVHAALATAAGEGVGEAAAGV
jgi:hypothetical protein